MENFKLLKDPWKYRFYEVRRLECPKCHGIFNYYKGVSPKSGKISEFTIPGKRDVKDVTTEAERETISKESEVLILTTDWEVDYWDKDRLARYTSVDAKSITHLVGKTPVAGIGVYSKIRRRDLSNLEPSFLVVKGININEIGEPYFDIHYIDKMHGIKSKEFLREIGERKLFFTLPAERVLEILKQFNISPPAEWLELLRSTKKTNDWKDWIGRHFLGILDKSSIGNEEFEDRIAEIFKALGFEVEQLGHKIKGEYPDGIVYWGDYAIIYDCKNRENYYLNADDKRALKEYVENYKKKLQQSKNIRIFFAIIAHSFENFDDKIAEIERETLTKGVLFTSNTMLYLLYKKLALGVNFSLNDFEKLILSKPVTIEIIDKVYSDK
ncbi:hypothetical protein DFR86_00400 [Acidianus sulfidivorans JP7]|uniref:FokI cleavage domain-containing protein n=1 Tax=Acidianus sulfidivorans JP7 TaxID=619593 RepID=A0A2U9IJP3_9CREN|nr:hypothetical protein [Acidianus sulfidivorans]AWR96154.1 hypothetical protein DFR86_00400 [Acidianus sulfidivorans JP7]